MGVNLNPDRSDVNENYFASAVLSVGTSAIEVKVGGSRNKKRQRVLIQNKSDVPIFLGPSGVTTSGANVGASLLPDLYCVYPIGDVALFAIADSASNDILVQEIG